MPVPSLCHMAPSSEPSSPHLHAKELSPSSSAPHLRLLRLTEPVIESLIDDVGALCGHQEAMDAAQAHDAGLGEDAALQQGGRIPELE